jgi:hypothetical protein
MLRFLTVLSVPLVVVVAVSGLIFNHKLLYDGEPKAEVPQRGAPAPAPSAPAPLTTSTDVNAYPVTIGRAMEQAREKFGDNVPLDYVHLNNRGGQLTYKIRATTDPGNGRDAIIDVTSGAASQRQSGDYTDRKVTENNEVVSEFRWYKLPENIHNGKFFAGKVIVDIAYIATIWLALAACYRALKRRV